MVRTSGQGGTCEELLVGELGERERERDGRAGPLLDLLVFIHLPLIVSCNHVLFPKVIS